MAGKQAEPAKEQQSPQSPQQEAVQVPTVAEDTKRKMKERLAAKMKATQSPVASLNVPAPATGEPSVSTNAYKQALASVLRPAKKAQPKADMAVVAQLGQMKADPSAADGVADNVAEEQGFIGRFSQKMAAKEAMQ